MSPQAGAMLPAFALCLNAFVWGVSWLPLRALNAEGLHPLWATALVYAVAVVFVSAMSPSAWRGLFKQPALWILLLASGATNVCFNWAVTTGDVVRVVLLFYLMPAWSMLIAWGLLGERPTRAGLALLLLSWAGVFLVLAPPTGVAWNANLAYTDLLGILGGMGFALTNVMLRKLHQLPSSQRSLAMFAGGSVCSCAVAAVGVAASLVGPIPPLSASWMPLALGLSAAFLASNLALQYGAARLPARTTALVMLSEVVFAAGSSVLMGASELHWRVVAGGAIIVLCALTASLMGEHAKNTTGDAK